MRLFINSTLLILCATRAAPGPTVPPTDDAVKIIERSIPDAVVAYRVQLPESIPPLPGYRAPILLQTNAQFPFAPPDSAAPPELQKAADIIGRRLAFDGMLNTLAQAIEALGASKFLDGSSTGMDLLTAAGFPLDWLTYFIPRQEGRPNVIAYIAQQASAGQTSNSMRADLGNYEFRFHATQPGFEVATESGEHQIEMIRLQLTRGGYWEGIGDGGNIDLTRQLIEQLPDVSFVASIERKNLDEFAALARTWPLNRPARLTLIPEPLIVAQWAQDNGKVGFIVDHKNGTEFAATIVPRFASRGEDGSTFVPGETFLLDGLAAAGLTVFQSPLLFQGGNVMAVRDPASGKRILLIGEAEVHRNTALGLTSAQVLDAFRIEFGVDQCEILPAVSFHMDYDVSIRAHNGKLLAFVNDTNAAVSIVLECGAGALEKHGLIDHAAAEAARNHLRAGRLREAVEIIGGPVIGRSDGGGHFPLSLAEMFSTGPMDSGVGNLQRFLLALDIAIGLRLQPQEMPEDRHARGYVLSLVRREGDREALHRQLAQLGFQVVPVPSLCDSARSINSVNGIHDARRYIMPAYGGLYAPLDEAAKAAFHNALGDSVSIVPIQCSESQRRVGAVHCSASVYPVSQGNAHAP